MANFRFLFIAADEPRPLLLQKTADAVLHHVRERILIPKKILLNSSRDVTLAFLILFTGRRLKTDITALPVQQVDGALLAQVVVAQQLFDGSQQTAAAVLLRGAEAFLQLRYRSVSAEFLAAARAGFDTAPLAALDATQEIRLRYLGEQIERTD